jgi:basic membrane protein A
LIIAETDPEQAQSILTSMQKNVDASIVRAIGLLLDGELPLGTAETLGLAENGVSLSVNDIYTEATPENVQELIAAATEAVVNGDVPVISVFGPEDEAASVGMGCAAMPEMEFDVSSFMGM